MVGLSFLSGIRYRKSQDKVDNDSSQQGQSQESGTVSIIKASLSPLPYTLGPPMEGEQGIEHGGHGDDSEYAGRDLTYTVTKVEKTDCKTAQDDGKVEP